MADNVIAKNRLVPISNHVDEPDLFINDQYNSVVPVEAFEWHTCSISRLYSICSRDTGFILLEAHASLDAMKVHAIAIGKCVWKYIWGITVMLLWLLGSCVECRMGTV